MNGKKKSEKEAKARASTKEYVKKWGGTRAK